MASKPAGTTPAKTPDTSCERHLPLIKEDLPLCELLEIIFTGAIPHGVERDLVRQFREMHESGVAEDRLPLTPECTVIYEQAFKYGRADIVIYHSDGTASVIEAKDGSKGYSHVIAGIGQASLYAVQLANTRGAVKSVRRCLLWSSTGSIRADAVIDEACEVAGVVALPYPSMTALMANRAAHFLRFERREEAHGCA